MISKKILFHEYFFILFEENSEIRARIPTFETDIDRCDAIWKFFNVKNPPDRAVQRAIYQESLPVLEDHVKKAENGDPYKFLEKITNDLANGQNLHAAIVFVAKLLQVHRPTVK